MNSRQNVIVRSSVFAILMVVMIGGAVQAETVVERQADSLFKIASSGWLKYRDSTEPAKDAIAELGAEAAPHLIDKFDTKSARERLTIIQILKKIGSPAVPDLVDALKRTDGLVVQRVCWALGDIKDSSAVEPLMAVCNHDRWQVRDQAIGALGKIGDAQGAGAIMTALKDTIGQVRKSAAVATGRLAMQEAVEELVSMLGDNFYGARLSALEALLKLDSIMVIQVVADSMLSANLMTGDLGCRVLGEIGTDQALDVLLSQTKSGCANRRTQAAVALIKADPLDNCGFRRFFLTDESDRLVKLKMESAINGVTNEP